MHFYFALKAPNVYRFNYFIWRVNFWILFKKVDLRKWIMVTGMHSNKQDLHRHAIKQTLFVGALRYFDILWKLLMDRGIREMKSLPNLHSFKILKLINSFLFNQINNYLIKTNLNHCLHWGNNLKNSPTMNS